MASASVSASTFASASASSDLYVDDAYLALVAENLEPEPESETPSSSSSASADTFQVSDEKYADGLQFQEALMSAVVAAQISGNRSSVTIRANQAPAPASVLRTIIHVGQSSKIFCEICDERKETEEMFTIESCSHSFCSDCISKHVAAKVWENLAVVACPALRCVGLIDFETSIGKLPKDVMDRWGEVKCEALIVGSEKFYCPFRDCSAVLVREEEEGGEVIRECECPECHRLFCARCNVAWHAGMECEELLALNQDEREREALMVRDLARHNKWGRCPQCKYYVERTEGCPHMTCRCKYEFCYGCGSQWSATHAGCQRE